jgi:hypothetical protein
VVGFEETLWQMVKKLNGDMDVAGKNWRGLGFRG